MNKDFCINTLFLSYPKRQSCTSWPRSSHVHGTAISLLKTVLALLDCPLVVDVTEAESSSPQMGAEAIAQEGEDETNAKITQQPRGNSYGRPYYLKNQDSLASSVGIEPKS